MDKWDIDFDPPENGYVRVVYVEDHVSPRPTLAHSRFRVYDVPQAKWSQFKSSLDPSDWLERHAIFRYADQGEFDVMVRG